MKRSRPTVEVSSLSDVQRAAIDRQLADRDVKPANVLDRDTKPDNVLPAPARSPYTGTGAKKGMSRNEQRFEAYLGEMRAAGKLSAWSYEVLRVKLPAHKATAVLDFVVRATGWAGYSGLVVVEVKPRARGDEGGPYFGPKGRLRIKLVAESLAGLEVPVLVAWPCGGGWSLEQIASSS